MKFIEMYEAAAVRNNSLVCVGLDPRKDSDQYGLSEQIIRGTADFACAFKPNSAFYEALGADGIATLKRICNLIKTDYPHIPIIVDAKRGDIGATSEAYAEYVFDYLGAHAVTLSPYLGQDALEPFLKREDRGCIILCRTSNPGARAIQDLNVGGKPLYHAVAELVVNQWNEHGNCLLVVGATYPQDLIGLRQIVGDTTFLVPGVGKQGGKPKDFVAEGVNSRGKGLIINSSSGIMYAHEKRGGSPTETAAAEVIVLRDEINRYRNPANG